MPDSEMLQPDPQDQVVGSLKHLVGHCELQEAGLDGSCALSSRAHLIFLWYIIHHNISWYITCASDHHQSHTMYPNCEDILFKHSNLPLLVKHLEELYNFHMPLWQSLSSCSCTPPLSPCLHLSLLTHVELGMYTLNWKQCTSCILGM